MQVVAADSVRGKYIDNTAIARVVFDLLGGWKPVFRSSQDQPPQPVETGNGTAVKQPPVEIQAAD